MHPRNCPKFYEAARSGTADFVNRCSAGLPMETEAMQFLNICRETSTFGWLFSWLLVRECKILFASKVLFARTMRAMAKTAATSVSLTREISILLIRGTKLQSCVLWILPSLPRSQLRSDEYPPLATRLVASPNGAIRRAAPEIHIMKGTRP